MNNQLLKAVRRAKILTVTGLGVRPGRECPICGNRLWFTPVDHTAHLCKRCGSLDRHRDMILVLRRALIRDRPGRSRILHIAPEECIRDELQTLPDVDYITGDLLSDDVDVEGLDLTRVPFADESFDLVICSHVLEHIPEDEQAMRELHRVLAPGGCVLINGPTDPGRTETYEEPDITSPAERLRVFGQEDHVRIYAQQDFIRRLECAGFSVLVDPGAYTNTERRRHLVTNDGGFVHTYLCSTSGSGDEFSALIVRSGHGGNSDKP